MNIRKFASLALVLLSLLSVSCGGFEARINEIFKFAGEQLKKTAVEVADPSKFPVNTTETGEWQTTGSRGWTSGFFPGCLWLAFEHTGDEEIKQLANKWTLSLDQIKYYTGNHDIGFMIFSSYGQGYRLTGNANFSDVIHTAAKSLMTRYNKDVQSIQSWNANNRWKFPVIVDNMMNLELLFWSARNGGSSELYDIAVHQACSNYRHLSRTTPGKSFIENRQ